MRVELLQITPNAEKVIEKAGRICYNSINKITKESHEKFIKNLIQRGHLSVLEHAMATFEISGVSRNMTHQLVRHRIASYSQESQRYVKIGTDYIIPDSIKENVHLHAKFIDLADKCLLFYQEMIDKSIKKEDARYIIPQAITTKIIMTANFREWRHFLKLRLHKSAQWEIRKVAKEILKILYNHASSVFEDIYLKINE